MKGLAKRNNKTRGKTTRKRKNRGKATHKRKNRGGSGKLANMAVVQPTYDDLVSDNENAEHRLMDIIKRTDDEFKAEEIEYVKYVTQLREETGYVESKHVDENDHPNKKTKINNDTKIAAAEEKLNKKLDALNKERDIAETEYKAEMDRIKTEYSRMTHDREKNEKHDREKAEIDEINANAARQKAKDQRVKRNPPSPSRSTDYMAPDQSYDPLSYPDYPKTADEERMSDMGDKSEWYGGKKRKYHKKRK